MHSTVDLPIGYKCPEVSVKFGDSQSCGKSRACRQLFSDDVTVDHVEVMRDLQQIFHALQIQYQQRWNFNFRDEEALDGKYIWTVMTPVGNDSSAFRVCDNFPSREYTERGVSNLEVDTCCDDREYFRKCDINSLPVVSHPCRETLSTDTSLGSSCEELKSDVCGDASSVVTDHSSCASVSSDYRSVRACHATKLPSKTVFRGGVQDLSGGRIRKVDRNSGRRKLVRESNFCKSRIAVRTKTIKEYFAAVKKSKWNSADKRDSQTT